MSKLSKYFINSPNLCTLTFQSDVPVTGFKSTHSIRGLVHLSSTSNLIWELTIQGFDESDNLIYQNHISNTSSIITFDFDFSFTCQKASAVLTILNPEVITAIYSYYYDSTFSMINHDGYGKMSNLKNIGYFGARYTSTSSVLFDILPNLQSLSWLSPDVNSFDDRFFQKELTNLTNLLLDFSFQPNLKIENLRKAPNLLTLDISDGNNFVHGNDIFLNFESDFNYTIKNYNIGSRYNTMLSTIHSSVAYLSVLQNYSHGGKNSGFDLTFPLFNNQDNTTLKKISIAFNSSIYNNHSNGNYTYPQNIERLLALEYINNYVFIYGDGANLFDKFYNMFYSKIYNETDNTKEGFSISSNSSYFNTLSTLPTGFVHPSFRKHTMCYGTNGLLVPLSRINKFNEVNATGFYLYASFES